MTRILSAIVIVAVVVGTLWFLPFRASAALAALVAGRAGYEIARLAKSAGAAVPPAFLAVAAAALAMAFVLDDRRIPGSFEGLLGAGLLALFVVAGMSLLALGPPTPQTLTQAAVMVMGPIYVGLPLGALIWVQSVAGAKATLWLVGVIAISDSAQYYVGRTFGRTKLAPSVSPAKTNEGAIGGLVAAALAGGALAPYCLTGVSRIESVAVAFVLAVFGIAGDLFESLLKRSVGAKDAASIIPGHGGVLDRIDAYLFAAPVFYLFLRYVA